MRRRSLRSREPRPRGSRLLPSPIRTTIAIIAVMLVLVPALPRGAHAQGLKIAVGDVGIGIGAVPRIDGIRLNFRDGEELDRVRGINATIWAPYDDIRGDIYGLALGLPLTGAHDITGIGLGGGVAAHGDFHGIGVAALGLGAGQDLRGAFVAGLGAGAGGDLHGLGVAGLGLGVGGDMRAISVAGLGVGAGGDVRGLTVAGLGIGAGRDLEGIFIAGLGAGAGGDVRGILLSGGGVGAGGDVTGLAVAGLGIGTGGDVSGIMMSGIGIGAGGDITGLAIAGVGLGSGGHLKGISLAGLVVGAPRITGLASALGVGGMDVRGVVVAPAYFRIEERGRLRGATISAYNDIRGEQHGLAIGLINIAEELHGLQIGLINIARNKETLPVMPLFNYSR